MRAELVIVPDASALKARCYELWSWHTNRSARNVRALLDQEYADVDVDLPTEVTIRHWVSRENWAERADTELAREYPAIIRQIKRQMLLNVLLGQQRVTEALTGVRPLDKDLAGIIIHNEKAWGMGTLGANQGGEMSLTFDADDAEHEALSTEQRTRKLRAMMSEKSRKHAS